MKKYTAKEVEELFNEFCDIDMSQAGTFKQCTQLFLKDKGITQQLEVGRWYKHDTDSSLVFIKGRGVRDSHYIRYGFDRIGQWYNEYIASLDDRISIEATDQEVETALIAEAKKRGFKEGVRFESAWSHSTNNCFYDGLMYISSANCLASSSAKNNCVFANGQWATIIEDEEMTLEQGGFNLNITNSSCETLVSFTVAELIKLKELIK